MLSAVFKRNGEMLLNVHKAISRGEKKKGSRDVPHSSAWLIDRQTPR